MAETEKQATFTGAQQHAGVYGLPFILKNLFGLGRPRAARHERAQNAVTHPPLSGSRGERNSSASTDTNVDEDPVVFEPGQEDPDEVLPKNCTYDWAAYHAAFGETPM